MSRVLVLWCPDWPAVAAAALAYLPAAHPVVVTSGNRVIACNESARAVGVRRGLRRRESQSRCPELYVAEADPDRDARLFEPVVAVLDDAVPGIEVLRPGLLAVRAQGVSRYFGSEGGAAERLVDQVSAVGVECQVGVADQLSTAVIAARRGVLVPTGGGARFLGPLPMSELAAEPSLSAPHRGELVDLLHRLGIRTIGAFADLSAVDVATRFGTDAVLAHRAARGEPERPPSGRVLPPDLEVEQHYDPGIDRVGAAAFAGRVLASLLHDKLSGAAVACTRLLITASAGNGEHLSRTWRCAEPLTTEGTADRVRWQLDGWLTGRNEAKPTTGITVLRLEPVEVVDTDALQLGLWGGVGDENERARRALMRVQGLLGGESVQMGILSGGRGPLERITLVPLGDERVPAGDPAMPWPGHLPVPSPGSIFVDNPQVWLTEASGKAVYVTERGVFSSRPVLLKWGSKEWVVQGWAGPWPVDERWWDPVAVRTAARVQVLLEESRALLMICEGGGWWVEGVYE